MTSFLKFEKMEKTKNLGLTYMKQNLVSTMNTKKNKKLKECNIKFVKNIVSIIENKKTVFFKISYSDWEVFSFLMHNTFLLKNDLFSKKRVFLNTKNFKKSYLDASFIVDAVKVGVKPRQIDGGHDFSLQQCGIT